MPMSETDPLIEKWQLTANQYRKDAENMASGPERERLLNLAKELETAAKVGGWLAPTNSKRP